MENLWRVLTNPSLPWTLGYVSLEGSLIILSTPKLGTIPLTLFHRYIILYLSILHSLENIWKWFSLSQYLIFLASEDILVRVLSGFSCASFSPLV